MGHLRSSLAVFLQENPTAVGKGWLEGHQKDTPDPCDSEDHATASAEPPGERRQVVVALDR